MLIFSIISIVVFVIYLQIGVIVLLKDFRLRLNQLFFFNALILALWALGYAMSYVHHDEESLILAYRIAAVGYAFLPFAIITTSLEFVKNEFVQKIKYYISIAVLCLSFLILYFLLSGLIKVSFVIDTWYNQSPFTFEYSLFGNLSFAFFCIICITSVFLLNFFKGKIEDGYLRMKQRLLSFSIIFFLSFYLIYDVLLFYMIDVVSFNLSYMSAIVWLLASAYVITRYNKKQDNRNVATEVVLKEMHKFLVFVNSSFLITNINSYSLKLINHKKSDLIETYLPDIFAERNQITRCLKRALKESNVYDAEFNLISRDGEHIPVLISFSLINDSFGDILGLAVFGNDNREALALKDEVKFRENIEVKMNKIKHVLDLRVKERTDELIESYKQLQMKITDRMQVEEQIKTEITEKEILISEIINRVKSNMQIIIALIETQTVKGLPEKAYKKFIELSHRVRSILLVHDNLYLSISYSYVDFASFIRTLVNELLSYHNKNQKINVKLNISEVYLDIDYAIPLGIVMNELVANALTHGLDNSFFDDNPDLTPELSISYLYNEGFYDVIIEDNGMGMIDFEEIEKKQTIGLKLIRVLINEQINGDLIMNSQKGKTSMKIHFKEKQ